MTREQILEQFFNTPHFKLYLELYKNYTDQGIINKMMKDCGPHMNELFFYKGGELVLQMEKTKDMMMEEYNTLHSPTIK
jgi:hypothetical protein